MSQHKDLPPNSQAWAKDVDALMDEVKQLKEVVRRLTENAGIDFSNPKRGLNASSEVPSTNNPVGQKLSSLADVQIYNVADKQVLNWSQKDQRWLPVTLPTPTTGGGGTVDISEVSYAGLNQGYGVVTDPANFVYLAAEPDKYNNLTVENWATRTQYMGAGNWNSGTGYALIQLDGGNDAFNRPFVQFSAFDYNDGTQGYFTVASYQVRVNDVPFHVHRVSTPSRPPMRADNDWGGSVWDQDLGIPIWWNGTTWTNALGTAV